MRWLALVVAAFAPFGAAPQVDAVEVSLTCVNPAVPFAVRIPTGWWVHPPDDERGISECEYLGPVPFTLTLDDNGLLTGGSVAIQYVEGCVGDFRDVVSQRQLTIVGLDATRIEFADGEGDPTPGPATSLVYWIHIRGVECDAGTPYIIASTSSADPEVYAENAAVLDAIIETFALNTVPDGATMRRDAGPGRLWVGLWVLGAGVALAAIRTRRQSDGST